MENRLGRWILAFAVLVFPGVLFAQQPAPPTDGEATPAPPSIEQRMATLEETLAKQQAVIDAQAQQLAASDEGKSTLQEETAQLKADVEELKEAQVATETAMAESNEDGNLLDIYGFMDVLFYKGFFGDDSAYNTYLGRHSAFAVGSVNLYFASQMTDTLSALVELRLSNQPQGYVTERPYTIYVDGDKVDEAGEYQVVETTVLHPYTTEFYKMGGIGIERAHLTWAPVDWFKVLVGSYLTPYGIWNVDHGSPVILGTRMPFILAREFVPSRQTGLQIFGRFYPRYDLFLDYAFTLSNGRGPIDSFMDLDDNKAMGLRLRLAYEGDNVTVAGGTYGYLGRSSEEISATVIYLTANENGDYVLDESRDRSVESTATSQNQYFEYSVTADFLLEVYGAGLQAEYVWTRKNMEKPGPLSSETIMLSGAPVNMEGSLMSASYTGQGWYLLGYWHMPLDKWIAPVIITPYFGYEFSAENDNLPYANFTIFNPGLNVKPSPYVSIKADFLFGIPQSKAYGENMKALTIQVAVSF